MIIVPGGSTGDIEGVTAGDGLSGTATSGTASLAVDLATNSGLEFDSNKLSIAKGISQHDVPQFTSGVSDDDFLRVDGTTIEGRSATEVLSDIGGLGANISSTPSNNTVSGLTATFTAGEALQAGECVYYKASDSKMHKAVAAAGSVTPPCIALAAENLSADASGKFLLVGFIRNDDDFPTYTAGDEVYTPEAETSSQNVPEATAPDSDGDLVQVLGIAIDGNTLYFNPSLDVIEHA